jgi:ADP-ribose pyrophosphatase YjhB (NUDIX family)
MIGFTAARRVIDESLAPLRIGVRGVVFCQQCGLPTEERLVEDRLRPVCLACGHVTYLDPKLAVAVVIEREGRLLFGRRGPGTREPGKWSFPAGFVERGERVEDAAVREVAEEVGLAVELGPLLGLYSATGETVVLAVFLASSAVGTPIARDDLVEVAWFLPNELPELAFPHDERIVDAWRTASRRQASGEQSVTPNA